LDRIAFPYRASAHLVLLHVIAESGAWQKHGLDVDYDRQISKSDAHRAVAAGDVEFVGGNHISTYAHRARGDKWVYLGQTLNSVHPKLAVRPEAGIDGVLDLRGKKIGTQGNHPGLNDWLYLRLRGLDVDRDDVELINRSDLRRNESLDSRRNEEPLWQWVLDGRVDAVFLAEPPDHLFAEQAGLKIIDLDPMPMIWFTTISSSLPFVEKHPHIVDRFLRGLIEGIHYFKTEPERSIDIIERRYTAQGPLNRAQATFAYNALAPLIEPNLYPRMSAIANVYEEAKRLDADAEKINPLQLWDLEHVRHLADCGFVKGLYETNSSAAEKHGFIDPDFVHEQDRRKAEMIAAVKACGHLRTDNCCCE